MFVSDVLASFLNDIYLFVAMSLFRFFSKARRMRVKRLSQITDEAIFLAGGRSRLYETLRVIRISLEFFHGFRKMHRTPPAVTVFGSARFDEGTPYYELSRRVGAAIARSGYTLINGGGPGIMEAISRGAKDAGGHTIGCNIILPHEQRPNRFLDKVVSFSYFFVRKVMLVKYSYAFVFLPGGFGTLDEMSEAITLIQTGKLYDFPVILVGSDYWNGFMEWVRNTMAAEGAVRISELGFLSVTDDPDEVVRLIDRGTRGLAPQDLKSTVD
jgi:uncharacterized protein (TIGR00730 family)